MNAKFWLPTSFHNQLCVYWKFTSVSVRKPCHPGNQSSITRLNDKIIEFFHFNNMLVIQVLAELLPWKFAGYYGFAANNSITNRCPTVLRVDRNRRFDYVGITRKMSRAEWTQSMYERPVAVIVNGILIVDGKIAGSQTNATRHFRMLNVRRHREIRRQAPRAIAKRARILEIEEMLFRRDLRRHRQRRLPVRRWARVVVIYAISVVIEQGPSWTCSIHLEWFRCTRLVPDPWRLSWTAHLVWCAANHRIRADETACLFLDLFMYCLTEGLRRVCIQLDHDRRTIVQFDAFAVVLWIRFIVEVEMSWRCVERWPFIIVVDVPCVRHGRCN